MQSLALVQAKKIVLLSQKLPPKKQRNGGALASTLSAIENLSYVQIDTISVIQRAHHHTLWNRNPDYQLSHVDQLLERREVFEYWSHAAAYLPMRDYRISLHRKNALASGKLKHWYKKDESVDIIYIALPNHVHHEYVIKAAQNGKAILCDKSLSVDMDKIE